MILHMGHIGHTKIVFLRHVIKKVTAFLGYYNNTLAVMLVILKKITAGILWDFGYPSNCLENATSTYQFACLAVDVIVAIPYLLIIEALLLTQIIVVYPTRQPNLYIPNIVLTCSLQFDSPRVITMKFSNLRSSLLRN